MNLGNRFSSFGSFSFWALIWTLHPCPRISLNPGPVASVASAVRAAAVAEDPLVAEAFAAAG